MRAGVIGVGSMGQNHARVYDEYEQTDLVGVADADEKRAIEIAGEYSTRALPTKELLNIVDVVSIAVPTAFHRDTAVECIQSGIHVLIEKPIAATQEEGRELIEEAEANNVTIQVGHIERFNPAITALDEFVDRHDIVAIHAERLGPPPHREIHENVVIDLMIHDVDILLSLAGEEPTVVQGVGTRENKYASAILEFESGITGTLVASRLTQRKVRKLKITTEEQFLEVDYLNQTIDIHRGSAPEFVKSDSGVQFRHESVIDRPLIMNHEPLKAEIESFVESVRNGTDPHVTGSDGLQAFKLVNEIDKKTRVEHK